MLLSLKLQWTTMLKIVARIQMAENHVVVFVHVVAANLVLEHVAANLVLEHVAVVELVADIKQSQTSNKQQRQIFIRLYENAFMNL